LLVLRYIICLLWLFCATLIVASGLKFSSLVFYSHFQVGSLPVCGCLREFQHVLLNFFYLCERELILITGNNFLCFPQSLQEWRHSAIAYFSLNTVYLFYFLYKTLFLPNPFWVFPFWGTLTPRWASRISSPGFIVGESIHRLSATIT